MKNLLEISVVLVLLLSWLGFSVAYIRRQGGWRALLQMLLLLVACSALAGLVLRPEWLPKEVEVSLLLVGEVDPGQLDSLQARYPEASVLRTASPGSPSLASLAPRLSSSRQLLVLGNGLSPENARYLEGINWQYLSPPVPPAYIKQLTVPSLSLPGDTVLLSLSLKSPPDNQLRLVVNGEPRDSVAAQELVRVRYRPTHRGLHHLSLQLLSPDGQLLDSREAYLRVVEAPSLRLALLTDYPSAESKFLKEYLKQQGHQVYYAAQLTPRLTQEERINNPPPFSLTQSQAYDALLVSAGWWQQQASYFLSPKYSGPGVLIFGAQPEESILISKNQRLYLRPATKAGWANYLQAARAPDLKSNALTYGRGGKIPVALRFSSTYPLSLQGKDSLYGMIWNDALRQVVDRPTAARQPLLLDRGARNQRWRWLLPPGQWQWIDPRGDTLVVGDSSQVSLISCYPNQSGTYQLQNDSLTVAYRIYEQATPGETAARMKKIVQISTENKQLGWANAYTIYQPISVWWFFSMFVLSAGLLWAVDRWYV